MATVLVKTGKSQVPAPIAKMTGATLLMTSELEDRYDELSFSPHGTDFLTDAIIMQRYVEVGSRLRRVMAVASWRW